MIHLQIIPTHDLGSATNTYMGQDVNPSGAIPKTFAFSFLVAQVAIPWRWVLPLFRQIQEGDQQSEGGSRRSDEIRSSVAHFLHQNSWGSPLQLAFMVPPSALL